MAPKGGRGGRGRMGRAAREGLDAKWRVSDKAFDGQWIFMWATLQGLTGWDGHCSLLATELGLCQVKNKGHFVVFRWLNELNSLAGGNIC